MLRKTNNAVAFCKAHSYMELQAVNVICTAISAKMRQSSFAAFLTIKNLTKRIVGIPLYFLFTIQETAIAKNPISMYAIAYMDKSQMISSRMSQYDNKNTIAKAMGNHHSFLMSFPTKALMVMTVMGFIAKKNKNMNPIISWGFAKITDTNGNISKTTNATIMAVIILLLHFIGVSPPKNNKVNG